MVVQDEGFTPVTRSHSEVGAFSIGVSLVAFSNAGEVRRFLDQARERHGHSPLIELSYAMSRDFLDSVSFLKGRVFSAHAPCPRAELFPNLGSRDPAVVAESLESIRASATTAAAFGARTLVLHAGYTLDAGVYSDPRRRLAALGPEGGICEPGSCETGPYRAHLETAVDNLRRACALCEREGVRLAVENLNPRLTYLFQLPGELAHLAREIPDVALCVDLAHLWIASLVHGFAFTDGLREILSTGCVASAHIHDNPSAAGPGSRLSDDHATIGSGRVPVADALPLLAAAGVRPLIVESLGPVIDSYSALVRLIEESCP